jgi:hypothetical protein
MIRILTISCFCGIASTSFSQFWDHSDPAALAGTVNTGAEESIPIFSKDSSTLYFVRTMDPTNAGGEQDQDIWYSTRDESGAYTNCQRLKDLNNKFNNAVAGIASDNSAIYLLNAYDGKKDLEKGLAVAMGADNKWGSPEKVGIAGLNIEGEFYGFHVNGAQDVIIISYKGAGSLGEEDLYVSTKTGGSWSTPQHMGSMINSVGFEIAPFLTPGNDTLFFSSNGQGGQGDADIFYSVKQGSWTSWSKPINLGSRINSPKFDAFFIKSDNQAFWSSNRDAERSDIYTIQIFTPPPIVASCSAQDASSYKGNDGSIDLTISGGAPPFRYKWSNGSSAEDAMGLAKGEYSVTITDAVGQTATSSCFVDEPPMPIEPVVVREYENINMKHTFGYNKNKVDVDRGELKRFLKDVEAQLEDGRQQITVKIVSSASNVPTKTFGTNEKLAEVRAENIKYDIANYFSKKYAGRVNVVIERTLVDGPVYEEDSANRAKYEPFQFVSLRTE